MDTKRKSSRKLTSKRKRTERKLKENEEEDREHEVNRNITYTISFQRYKIFRYTLIPLTIGTHWKRNMNRVRNKNEVTYLPLLLTVRKVEPY